MTEAAWLLLGVASAPVIAGAVAGAVVARGAWPRTLKAAAYATGVVVALFDVIVLVVMFTHASAQQADHEAAIQIVFTCLLAIPAFPLALLGAAIGRTLARALRRR